MVPSGTRLHYIQLALHATSPETFVSHILCFNVPQVTPALSDSFLIVWFSVDIVFLEGKKKEYFLAIRPCSPFNLCSWNIMLDKNESQNLSLIFWLGWDFWIVTFTTSHHKLISSCWGTKATLILWNRVFLQDIINNKLSFMPYSPIWSLQYSRTLIYYKLLIYTMHATCLEKLTLICSP